MFQHCICFAREAWTFILIGQHISQVFHKRLVHCVGSKMFRTSPVLALIHHHMLRFRQKTGFSSTQSHCFIVSNWKNEKLFCAGRSVLSVKKVSLNETRSVFICVDSFFVVLHKTVETKADFFIGKKCESDGKKFVFTRDRFLATLFSEPLLKDYPA